MKVSILDDYFDTLRTLDCFRKLAGQRADIRVAGRFSACAVARISALAAHEAAVSGHSLRRLKSSRPWTRSIPPAAAS